MSFVACVSFQLSLILVAVYSIVLIDLRETLLRVPTNPPASEFKRKVLRLVPVPASPKIN